MHHTYQYIYKDLCKGMLHAYVNLHFSSLSFREALAPEMVPSTQYAMASSVKVRKTALGTVTYRSSEAKSQVNGTSSGHLFLAEPLPLIFKPKYIKCPSRFKSYTREVSIDGGRGRSIWIGAFFSQRSSDFWAESLVTLLKPRMNPL